TRLLLSEQTITLMLHALSLRDAERKAPRSGRIRHRSKIRGDPASQRMVYWEIETMPEVDLIKTGIAGLDDILFGGIPRGNVVIVTGAPGTGKTILGLEFIYRGVHEFDEPG